MAASDNHNTRKYSEYKNIKATLSTDKQTVSTDKQKRRKKNNPLMELQPFDSEIIHRPKTKMKHVGALSGMFIIQTPRLQHNLKKAQDKDEHILAITEIIKEKP